MKNVAKIKIVLHDPDSNALCNFTLPNLIELFYLVLNEKCGHDPVLMHCVALSNLTEPFLTSKMKNVAKNEIVLHDPYSNALCSFI